MKTQIIHNDNYYFDIVRLNIKKYRHLANMTQQQLADASGLTMNYIAKIESQKMQRGFTLVALGRIADALNIEIAKFFEE